MTTFPLTHEVPAGMLVGRKHGFHAHFGGAAFARPKTIDPLVQCRKINLDRMRTPGFDARTMHDGSCRVY
ncbi:MAG: hypothetical protein J2P53_17830 [Bradyrhizobiaceae bacterium]|nr:hypothetical protein [Bradyrhizobiaceae bacterium]